MNGTVGGRLLEEATAILKLPDHEYPKAAHEWLCHEGEPCPVIDCELSGEPDSELNKTVHARYKILLYAGVLLGLWNRVYTPELKF